MIVTQVPDGHVWLRITRPHYADPFDPSFAHVRGGRWNPPGSWPTLYLNEDLATVHAQVLHLFAGRGVEPDDLDDDAPIRLAACTLPGRQRVCDAISDAGLDAVGLPSTYPLQADGSQVPHATTTQIGVSVHRRGLRGVWCRSAAGIGHELAWFPAERAAARPTWRSTSPLRRLAHRRRSRRSRRLTARNLARSGRWATEFREISVGVRWGGDRCWPARGRGWPRPPRGPCRRRSAGAGPIRRDRPSTPRSGRGSDRAPPRPPRRCRP